MSTGNNNETASELLKRLLTQSVNTENSSVPRGDMEMTALNALKRIQRVDKTERTIMEQAKRQADASVDLFEQRAKAMGGSGNIQESNPDDDTINWGCNNYDIKIEESRQPPQPQQGLMNKLLPYLAAGGLAAATGYGAWVMKPDDSTTVINKETTSGSRLGATETPPVE